MLKLSAGKRLVSANGRDLEAIFSSGTTDRRRWWEKVSISDRVAGADGMAFRLDFETAGYPRCFEPEAACRSTQLGRLDTRFGFVWRSKACDRGYAHGTAHAAHRRVAVALLD